MTEPLSRMFERTVIAVEPSEHAICDVSRRHLRVEVPREGWHLMSDAEIDAVLSEVCAAVRKAAPYWVRSRHLTEKSPEWLKARHAAAIATPIDDHIGQDHE